MKNKRIETVQPDFAHTLSKKPQRLSALDLYYGTGSLEEKNNSVPSKYFIIIHKSLIFSLKAQFLNVACLSWCRKGEVDPNNKFALIKGENVRNGSVKG